MIVLKCEIMYKDDVVLLDRERRSKENDWNEMIYIL